MPLFGFLWVGSSLMMDFVRCKAEDWLMRRANRRADRAELFTLPVATEESSLDYWEHTWEPETVPGKL